MSGLDALRIAVVIVPIIAFLPIWQRDEKQRLTVFRPGVLALLSGGVAFGISFALRSFVLSRLGISDTGVGAFDLVALAFAVLVAAPVDETLRALAVVAPLRSKQLKRPYDAMRVVLGSALGFGAGEALQRIAATPSSWLLTTRLVLDITVHVSLSCLWGFTLARERRRRLGGAAFSRAFVAVILFGAVASELLFASGPMAIWAAAPLVVSGVLIALLARRDLLRMSEVRQREKRRALRVNAPSIEELERALLQKPDRPVMLRWILLGAFVTTGVLTSMIAGSVALGHNTGVDFAAVDNAASFEKTAPPLVLLGTGSLGAFPIAGYLVARASAARSVLEPALGSSVAIFGVVVLLGLAAPVAVVFGLALAPVAFALACAGAWIGLER